MSLIVNLSQIIIVPPANKPTQRLPCCCRDISVKSSALYSAPRYITRPCASSCNPHSVHLWAGLVPASEKQVKEAISEGVEIIVLYQAASFWPIQVPLFLFEWTHGGGSVCQGKETLQIILALYLYFSLIRTSLPVHCVGLVSTAPFWEHL